MKRTLLLLATTIIFIAGSASVSLAKFDCVVESVQEGTVILKNCDAKKAAKLKAGEAVAVTKKKGDKEEK